MISDHLNENPSLLLDALVRLRLNVNRSYQVFYGNAARLNGS